LKSSAELRSRIPLGLGCDIEGDTGVADLPVEAEILNEGFSTSRPMGQRRTLEQAGMQVDFVPGLRRE